jgi:hypothetical protein
MAEGVMCLLWNGCLGNREGTLRTWLTPGRDAGGQVHSHFFHHLILNHIQLDELWANVRQGSQETWVWAVVEASSKLVPVLKMGPRTMDLAYAVVHDLSPDAAAWLHFHLHQRWVETVFLCLDSSFWVLAPT